MDAPIHYGLLASGPDIRRLEAKLDLQTGLVRIILQKLGTSAAERALIIQLETKLTKEIDDLNAAIADLSTAVTSTDTQIASLSQQVLDAHNNDDSDGVEAGVNQIRTLIGNLNTAVSAVSSAVPPVAAVVAAAPGAGGATT